MRSPIAAEKKWYTENRMTKEQHNLKEICGNRVISPTHPQYKKSYFPSFRRPKISSICIFSVYKEDDIFLVRKVKKRFSYCMFSMLWERRYFLHQKINEKIILRHVCAVLEIWFFLPENERKSQIYSWAWRSLKNSFTLCPIFLKIFFLNNSSIFTERDDKEIWLYFWQETLILT